MYIIIVVRVVVHGLSCIVTYVTVLKKSGSSKFLLIPY